VGSQAARALPSYAVSDELPQPAPATPQTAVGSPLTAAIATYNGRALLPGVLDSLARQTVAEHVHVVVVDDCSTDGTVEWLREEWPAVEVVAHERNLGVTRSLNDCLAAARGEFVVLLNNDVELEPDCLERLVAELEEHSRAAVSCPKLLDFRRREYLDGAGDIYTWSGLAGRRGHGELDRGQYDRAEEVLGACAAVAVYRRSVLEQIGDFDEAFFSYYEDIDWALRARLAGYSCRYVPSAVAYHMGGGTLGDALSDFARYHLRRNGVWLIVKDLPAGALARHGHELLHGQLWSLRRAIAEGRGRLWMRAWRDALRGLPGMLRKRRSVQRLRRGSLSEFERMISPP
jgi:GT2 family glycosyltransferase